VYSCHGHGNKFYFHHSWIQNVLDWEAILISLMSMGMPDSEREYSYLIFADDLCSWINCLGTFIGFISMHHHLLDL
jgi:hypothetical protein